MTLQLLLLMLIGCLAGVISSNVTNEIKPQSHDCPVGCVCNEEVIDCSYIGLEAIPYVSSTTRVLVLRGNRIMRIRSADITRLSHLDELHLQGNRIQDITGVIFNKVLKLQLLDLSNNPLYCGCRLKTKLDLLSRQNVTVKLLDLEGTMCKFPRRLRGQSISVLTRESKDVCGHQRKRRDESDEENECEHNLCQHGGECIMGPRRTWQCVCKPGYSGQHCEWRNGEQLSLTVSNKTRYEIELQWITYAQDIMEFRIFYEENRPDPPPSSEQTWLNGTSRRHRLKDLQPDTVYKICLAAFSFDSKKRSPGNLIEEVCLLQRTDTIPTTMDSHPYKPLTNQIPPHPSFNGATDDIIDMQSVMIIFGVILSICIVLIFAVVTLYIFRQRGMTLLPRRWGRRRSPPNIVQIQNATYGSTGSPTPSVQDVPIGENATVNQDNDVPLILVTSENNITKNHDNRGLEEMDVDASSYDGSAASSNDFACAIIDGPKESQEREAGDGASTHADNYENGHLIKDNNNEPDRPEEEVIQC